MKSHRLPLIVVAAAALLTLSTANAGAREAPTQTEAQQAALVAPVYSEAQPASLPADVTGPQRVIMLRVYFNDYANTSRYSRADVEGLMAQVDTLYQNTSYGNVSIEYQVSEIFQLPDNRSDYVDDGDGAGGTPCDPTSWGDLSCDDKYFKLLEDAIAASPDDLDWTNVDAVLVLMAETDPAQFHRGQGGCCWSLPMGPDGDLASVAAAVVSENPDSSDRQVWGRWAHEIGHGLQQTELLDTGHPSNYNSEFELMDSNYPGQTGVFEKQAHLDFPGWLPEAKFQTFTPSCDVGPDPCTGLGGGMAFLWAMEYDPGGRPNDQAVKAYITDNLYYLVSVRRRVLGDELNGDYPNGIPDEGVLIERVEEGADPWVTLKSPSGDPDPEDLWHAGGRYDSVADGISIIVDKKIDDDNYAVYITYDQQASRQPDVGLNPWRSPPGNVAETTDIWMDSPVNDYGTYRYGMWDDGTGREVPRGNGDDPAIGHRNRFYARVRNYGGAPASDVVVHFWLNDPPGMGMNGENGFIELGSVSSADFPALANIDPAEFVDVYLVWTPDFEVSEEDMAAGRFNFHTCVRVTIDAVDGETVLGNQDGDREQENITYFQAPPEDGAPAYGDVMNIRNDDTRHSKYFYLSFKSNLPPDWKLDVNGGVFGMELGAGELRTIPIRIIPGSAQPVGSIFGVDVKATSWRTLVNARNPKDRHSALEPLGSVRVETRVTKPTRLTCQAERPHPQAQSVLVRGRLTGFEGYLDPKNPPRIMIEGIGPKHSFLTSTLKLVTVSPDGSFTGYLAAGKQIALAQEVICLFAGTTQLSGSSSGYVPIRDNRIFLPLVLKEWLLHPPVTHTLTLMPMADAYVSSAYPKTNFGSELILYVGRAESVQLNRALFRFDLSHFPSTATVLSASFRANLVDNPALQPTMTVELERITTSWDESSVKWASQPAYTSTGTRTLVGPSLGYYTWDVTGLVHAWQSGTPNYGLALISSDESSSSYHGFSSRENSKALPPRLVITYRP